MKEASSSSSVGIVSVKNVLNPINNHGNENRAVFITNDPQYLANIPKDLDLSEFEISFYLRELGYDELVSIYEAILRIERKKRAEAELKAADLESGFWRKIKRLIKKANPEKIYRAEADTDIFAASYPRVYLVQCFLL